MPPLSPWLERWWSQRRTPQLQFGSGRTAVRLPAEREAQFVLISGPARCGKTRRVVANLGHWSGSAVVIDREGETARATARERRGLGGQVAYLEASEDGQWPRIDGAGLLERPTTLYLLVRRTTPQLGGVLLDLVRALWDRMELGETTPRVPVAVFLDGVLDPVEVPLIELAREVRAVRGGGLLLLAYIPTLDRWSSASAEMVCSNC